MDATKEAAEKVLDLTREAVGKVRQAGRGRGRIGQGSRLQGVSSARAGSHQGGLSRPRR